MLLGEGRDEVAVAEGASAADRGLVPAFKGLESVQQGVDLGLGVGIRGRRGDGGFELAFGELPRIFARDAEKRGDLLGAESLSCDVLLAEAIPELRISAFNLQCLQNITVSRHSYLR